jgi:phosphate-selective porin OprO/OprP
VLVVLRYSIFLFFSLQSFATFTTENQIQRMEDSLAQTDADIKALELEQKQNKVELEKTKYVLRKHKTSPSIIPKYPDSNFLQLDYTRYRPSPYKNYFKYTSIDGSNQLEFHGWLQVDQDIFFDSLGLLLNSGASNVPIVNKSTVDRLWLRRLRPTIEGTIANYFNFMINPDIGGQGQVRLFDAFIDINYFRALGLQSGLQMSLLSGIENYFDNFNYLARAYTMEMSNTAMLAPDRQFGFVFHGSFGPSGEEPYFRGLSYLGFDDMLSYQLGVFSGIPDNANASLDPVLTNYTSTDESTIQNKALAGRLFWNPFIAQPKNILQHLGLGFAGSIESPHLETALPYLDSLGQNLVFLYQNPPAFIATIANGQRTRIHPQAVWSYGPLGLLADMSQTTQKLESGVIDIPVDTFPKSVTQKNSANQVQLIYNLTKEDFNLFHLIPNRNFNPTEKGAWGAWQLVMRYTGMSLDSSVFSEFFDFEGERFYYFADPRGSIQSSTSWSVGINWFWNTNIRFTTEYAESHFHGGCSTGAINAPINPGCYTGLLAGYGYEINSQVINRPAEKIFMQRFQLTF